MTRAELFTPLELDFLWESFGAGELPYPLQQRSHGRTLDERAHLRGQVYAGLAQRGVTDDRGRPEPHVEEFFEVLTGAQVSLDSVHIAAPEARPLLAVASTFGASGLLTVQDERGFHFHPIPPDGLASAIVSLLPGAARGSEKSITVPLDQLVSSSGADFLQRRAPGIPGGRGPGDDDRKALARLQAQPRLRGGQIGANARNRMGSKSRAPVLSWFDTDAGRYFTQGSRGQDGRDWITIAPADAATLRYRLGEMLAGAADTTMAPGGAW
ncbi:MAG TPA: ESX secretion-associated protein EspG [Amycolatopsis sp.]|nr:ESX secretion-associated protein EspG [Amycolatopsis sp.]